MNGLAIARVELLRLLRDRSNIFFVFVFPLLLVVLIGAGFGGGLDQRLGVVAPDDAAARALTDDLDALDGVAVVPVDDEDDLAERVARGHLAAGVVLPAGLDDPPADGGVADVVLVARDDPTALGMRALVEAQVAERAAVLDAAGFAATRVGGTAREHLAVARELQGRLPGVEVRLEAVGGDELAQEFAGMGQFDQGASSQLFLFTFLTSVAAAGALIQSRQLGVTRRMFATPTSGRAVLAGHGAGRLLVAVAQAAYIVVATVLLFRVDWGDPLATGAVVLAFCLVSGGAGMLVGATLRNDSQAAGIGVGLALGMAALGGSMVPLEIFPEGVRTAAHVTPHAWANGAMAEIVRRGGGLGSVVPQVGVLLAYGAVLYGLATWRLRRTLTG